MLPAIFSLSGPVLTADERALFVEAEPAGYMLFARNIADREQLRALTASLRDLAGRDCLILVDQEGGRVARLGPPHWPVFPAAARFGALYETAPISGMEAARLNALAMALMLHDVGINVSCLPLLDLRHPDTHEVIGDRALSSDPLQVASLGRAILDGLAEGGVAGVIKHLPGHGRARADSHRELPVVAATAEEMALDLMPFRALADRARIGMTAHILYPAWDEERPATLSPTIVGEVIRGAIGFDGLLLSDDIGMGALSGTVAERAAGALAAGCDLVLHCSGDLQEMARLVSALSPAGERTLERATAALPAGPVETGDPAELLARRDALLELVQA